MRGRLASVFTAFGTFAEDAQEDGYRIAKLETQVERLERANERLGRELSEVRKSRDTLLESGPRDAAAAIAEELSDPAGRLAGLARWSELTEQERAALKNAVADAINSRQIPF